MKPVGSRILYASLAMLATAATVGCGGDDSETSGTTPKADAGTDAKTDTGSDTGNDTGGDAGTDTGTDTGTDAAVDVVCPTGYTGPTCSDCADGYQDNDSNGSCLPDCATTVIQCLTNQVCDDSAGEVACVCDDGYQDNDGNGSCLEDCTTAALVCGDHEACDDTSGEPECTCEDGYQDNDVDGTCEADCTTAALACGNGQCDDMDGEARCVCDEGYDGVHCDKCDSPYYQDFDEDGVCETTCYFEKTTCGTNEVCSDESGAKECICEDGYQDNDTNATCLPDCATAMADNTNPLACPDENAHCDDATGTAVCECDEGYADDTTTTEDDCLACATGYQDNDANGTCLEDCTTAVANGLTCGSAGCDDSSGIALCACPTGEQDNDLDGVCEPDCSTATLTCAAANHEVCSDASGTATCVCDTGYYDDGLGICLVSGAGGDGCADVLELTNLSDRVLVGDMTSMTGDVAFSCNSYGLSFTDMIHHIHVAAGATRDMNFTVDLFDVNGDYFIPAVTLLEGADCATATEVACGYGIGAGGSIIPASIDVTLDGGTGGADYYLVVGFMDYFGTGASLAQTYITNYCPTGELYSAATDTCVADPCQNPNPCTEANKNACASDASVSPATYACSCNVGYVDNGGACEQNPSANGEACADVIPIPVAQGQGQQIAGTTAGALDDGEGACSAEAAPDRVYGFTLTETMHFNATMTPVTDFDVLMHLRTTCDDPDSQVACADVSPNGVADTMSITLQPGTYYLFADGWNGRPDPLMAEGDFTLDYSFYTDPCADEETACPNEPVCHADPDWSGFECVCETPGELFHNDQCVADPCDGATCGENTHCTPDLANATYDCECDAIYVDDGSGGCEVKPDAKWTFIMYWSMDNNLFAQAEHELDDWMNVEYNPDVRFIALVDGWGQNSYIAEMLPGQRKVVHDYGENIDTGDWQTLADYGQWVVEHYPAEHYVLIPSDHGGAWRNKPALTNPALKGICYDDSSGNYIGIANGEFSAALTAITNAAGQNLDFIVYDACLMSTWEMAEVGAPYADYMIASEESQYGWQIYPAWLTYLIDNIDSITNEELGQAFIDLYSEGGQFDYPGNYYAITAALTDLSTTDDLTAAVSAFGDALRANESTSFYAELDQVRMNSHRMQSAWYGFLLDLGDFARNVRNMNGVPADVQTAADALLAQLKVSIPYDWANIHDSYAEFTGDTGLSIFLPPAWYAADGNSFANSYVDSGAIWTQHSTWDEFLKTFASGTGGFCASGTEALGYMGATVSDTLDIDRSYRSNRGPYIVQSFIAPSGELHNAQFALIKTVADAHQHDGFTVGLRNAAGEWIYEPAAWLVIEPNAGDIQYGCVDLRGIKTEPGEVIDLVLFGGEPPWHYDGNRFDTPISWPITYAADDSSDPPYAGGDVYYNDGQNGEMPIQDYNQDGIRASMWFNIY